MSDKAVRVYLNDHRTGAEVARHVVDHLGGLKGDADLTDLMAWLRDELARDRTILDGLMASLNVPVSRPKALGAWLAGRAAPVKLSTFAAGSGNVLLGLESLAVGIQGKMALWRTLQAADDRRLAGVDFAALLAAAEVQFEAVEAQRLRAGKSAFS
jgi:hypothetical protein